MKLCFFVLPFHTVTKFCLDSHERNLQPNFHYRTVHFIDDDVPVKKDTNIKLPTFLEIYLTIPKNSMRTNYKIPEIYILRTTFHFTST